MNISTYGFLIGMALVLIIWFLFIAPMEKRMHDRKMDLMRRKLEQNEQRIRRQQARGKGDASSEDSRG